MRMRGNMKLYVAVTQAATRGFLGSYPPPRLQGVVGGGLKRAQGGGGWRATTPSL